jgi:ATP-binding cassette, subfamily B (MDR/TAP), member 1
MSVQVVALSNAFAAAQGVVKFMKEHEQAALRTTATGGVILDKVEGHIEFRDVHFSYPSRPEALIFDGLTCEFPALKTTAVIGASGSGKSTYTLSSSFPTNALSLSVGTVVALIERWFEINGGSILLDGVDVGSLDPRWFRKQIGLVNQVIHQVMPININRRLIDRE